MYSRLRRAAIGIVLAGTCLLSARPVFGEIIPGYTRVQTSGESRIFLSHSPALLVPGQAVSFRVQYVAKTSAYKGVHSPFSSLELRLWRGDETLWDKTVQSQTANGDTFASFVLAFPDEAEYRLEVTLKDTERTLMRADFVLPVKKQAPQEAVKDPVTTGTRTSATFSVPRMPKRSSSSASSVSSLAPVIAPTPFPDVFGSGSTDIAPVAEPAPAAARSSSGAYVFAAVAVFVIIAGGAWAYLRFRRPD